MENMVTKKSKRTRKPNIAHLEARITKEELLSIRNTGYDNLADWIENRFKSDNRINLEEVAARPLPAVEAPVVEAPVVEAPAVEAPVIADSEIPAEIPAHLKVEMLKTGNWSFWCPVCQEGATARAFVIGGLVEHHANCKPSKRKRKASSEPRKRSITEKPRKVRTRKSKQVVENFHGYTTKKLAELVEQPYTDTGLEVCQEAAWEEYCLRLDAMSDDLIAEYLEEPKAHVAENPADWAGIIGFEGQSEEEAAPVIIVSEPVKAEAPAPVLMLPAPAPRLLLVQLPPPIRPDMIRKPMPPAPPADFEWILPPAPKAPVCAGLFSRVWSALKKIA